MLMAYFPDMRIVFRHPALFCVLCIAGLLAAIAFAPARTLAQAPPQAPSPQSPQSLDELSKQLDDQIEANRLLSLRDQQTETTLTQDAIPAINNPQFISVEDATLSNDMRDIVFVAEFPSGVRIYPRLVLIWHEIVNDVVNNNPVSITYCPLTGSVMGFSGSIGNYKTGFGTSGLMLFNNQVMYDRSTNSHWPQLLGIAIEGPLYERKLKTFPLIWTTFGKAIAKYPNAKVLSRDTGYRRSYGKDPYGSYRRGGTYYQNNLVTQYIPNLDKRLPLKEQIIGVPADGSPAAIIKSEIRSQKVINFDVGLEQLVVLYDPSLDTARVFDRSIKRRTLHFEFAQGRIMDKESGSEWNPEGQAVAGSYYGEQLKQVPAFDSMWFAWASFYPGPEIVPGKNDDGF